MTSRRLLSRIAAGLVVLVAGSSGATEYSLEAIALEGDATPAGGTFSSFTNPCVNANGDVAFVGNIAGGPASQGIFTSSGGVLSTEVLLGDTAPGTAGGTFLIFSISDQCLSDSGEVVFRATITGGSHSDGVWTVVGGTTSALAVDGDTAPDTGLGQYSSPFVGPIINGSGDIVFKADVVSGSSTRGVFLYQGGSGSALVLVGDVAPSTGGATYDVLISWAINDDADVAFVSRLAGASSAAGIFTQIAGSDARVELDGDPAPAGVGGTYGSFSGVPASINASGDVLFRAAISGGAAAAGIFRHAAGTTTEVVLAGDAAPAITGGTYTTQLTLSRAALNDVDDFVFRGVVTGGLASSGVFVHSGDTDSAAALVGQTVPGSGGQTFTSLGGVPKLNDAGQAAIYSLYGGSSRGVFLATPSAFTLGTLASTAGPLSYREDLDGETAFPTVPEVDVRSIGGLLSQQVGNGPPAAPTLSLGRASFSVTDAVGASPFEYAAIGTNVATIQASHDAGIAGRFDSLSITGAGPGGVGVSMTTSGGTAFRAEVTNISGPRLEVLESVGSSTIGSTSVALAGLPTGQFAIELLVDRQAGTAQGLLKTDAGDVFSPALTLSSAVSESIPTFGPLAFVLNGTGAVTLDVELENVPTGGAALLVLALGAAGMREARRARA